MKQYLLIILLSMIGVCSYSQQIKNTDFVYPIKPGEDKWEKMISTEERIASLQIPENILNKIYTERLLNICLDYPYILDVLFYNDYQEGINALRDDFNGFNELLNRKDLGKIILAMDKKFPLELDKLRDKDIVEKGKFSFRYFILELILAQDNVLATLSINEEDELLDITIQNLKLKTKQPDIFGDISTTPSYFIYAKKALIDSNFNFTDAKQKNDVIEFINRPVGVDDNIIECVKRYFKNKKRSQTL